VHRKYIPIYIQQDATLHSLFISGNCSTCFGWYLRPSSGAQTTVSTASGICHTVIAIWHSFLTGAKRVTILETACIQLRRRAPEDEQGNARNM
jgi:hypothetical protein